MSSQINSKMRRKGRRTFIENYRFSPSFEAKLREELGDARHVDTALEGLRAWYLACLCAGGELIGMPSKTVDIAWHEMILRTREYHGFCQRAFGQYLHHSPDSTLDIPMSAILPETLRIVEENKLSMVLFTADEDTGIPGGYLWSATELHSMRDRYAADKAVGSAKRKRRAAWGTSGGVYSAVAGRYTRVITALGHGWQADGAEPPTAAEMAAHAEEIADDGARVVPASILDEIEDAAGPSGR